MITSIDPELDTPKSIAQLGKLHQDLAALTALVNQHNNTFDVGDTNLFDDLECVNLEDELSKSLHCALQIFTALRIVKQHNLEKRLIQEARAGLRDDLDLCELGDDLDFEVLEQLKQDGEKQRSELRQSGHFCVSERTH